MDFQEEDFITPDLRPRTSGRDEVLFENGGRRSSSSSLSRPLSRHGVGPSPPSQQPGRPFSRQSTALTSSYGRPTSGRLGSAFGQRPGPVPGTASRLTATAQSSRPFTSSRAGLIGMQNLVPQVADRPITQQGLTGLRTAGPTGAGGSSRQFQDKSYFLGVLRAKMAELATEIGLLRQQIREASEEQSTFLAYEKRVKEAAAELTEQQARLSDYNLLLDKLNTDTDIVAVESEAREIISKNEVQSAEIDGLFSEKQEQQEQIRQLEQEIEQESHMAENIISTMQPDLRERYLALKRQNLQYQRDLEQMNQELDELNSRKALLDREVAVSSVKKEALTLLDSLRALEGKRDELKREEENRGTPAQERERLLNQVKEDNAEIATMEQQISDLNDQLGRLQDEQTQLEQELEESNSERNQKYRELRKKEESMESFLANFESLYEQEVERCVSLQHQIEDAASSMSSHLSNISAPLPSRSDFLTIKEDLALREDDIEKSRNTLEGLNMQHSQLQINLEKIETLEGKIKAELASSKEKMATMQQDMLLFSDLDKVRAEAAQKRQLLEQEHLSLSTRKLVAVQSVDQTKAKSQSLMKQLAEHETAVQLANLEKKLSHLEQSNFSLEEFLANKKAEMNFEMAKNKVLKLQHAYNKLLVENVRSPA